ncbi:MAG: hypothetical protein QOJ81_1684 [Chloroflexota bacterium]|jgi:hypothetical protein|nr:hypothetical protein [Chloroflexota bacterium]
MPETTLTLLVAALLFFIALIALLTGRAISKRLGAASAGMRALDARLGLETPLLTARIDAARDGLAAVSTGTEKALWSLARFDERLDATRVALVARREDLDRERARLVAARAGIARTMNMARMAIKAFELRRAILG